MADNHGTPHRGRRLAWALVVASTLAICLLTLRPEPTAGPLKPPICFPCGEESVADLVLNLALFAPLGLGLALIGVRGGRAAALLLALTVAIEWLQFRVIAGRDASLLDIIANWLGGGLAFVLARYRRDLVRPSEGKATVFAVSTAMLWLLLFAAGVAALHPTVRYQHYWVQWMPVHRGFVPFRGQVLSADLNGNPLLEASVLPPELVAVPLRSGNERITVVTTAGPPPGGRATIVRLAAPTFEVFSLIREGAAGGDLRFQSWVRGATLGFRRPSLVVPGAFPTAVELGDTVVISAGVRDGIMYARLSHGGVEQGRTLSLSPGLAWVLLMPRYRVFDSRIPLFNAAWTALLLLPLGYWAALALPEGGRREAKRRALRSTAVFAALLAALLACGLELVPRLLQAPAAGWPEWTGGVIALAAGWAAALIARRKFNSRPAPLDRS